MRCARREFGLFFIISNFGEWLYSGIYRHTPNVLITCYVAAIPLFQNTLAEDLFYSTLPFGGFVLQEERVIPVLSADAATFVALIPIG